jgi:ATP-dependent RNA helicase DeaD
VLRYFDASRALIFCATREAVRHLHAALRERGFSSVALSGELSQKDRSDALQALRDGQARACVATDVAARGLDLPELDLVIHAELPQSKPTLLHRSGRTGRAGRKGVSVLLVPFTRQRKAQQLLASAQVNAIWSGPPLADEIRERDHQRLLDGPLLREPPSEEDLALGRKLLEGRAPEALAAAFARLYRAGLPEPEEVFDDRGQEPAPRERSPRDRPMRERAHMTAEGSGAWFRMPVGRQDRADPKWLIPLICRRGHVTKRDIGEIRIFGRETKFEISAAVEGRFREALRQGAEGDVPIEPAGEPGPGKAAQPRKPPRRNQRPKRPG